MLKKLGIYVPSRERSGVICKGALTKIPSEVRTNTFVVVAENEVKDYIAKIPKDIQVLGTPHNGIAPVRQWILETSEYPYVLFMSDDLKFSYRNEEKKLKPCGEKEILEMLKEIYRLLSEYVHVGVSQRAFNHVTEDDYEEIQRMNDVYAYRREDVLASGARFDDMQVMEDFDLTLTLLERGFPNIVTYKYAWNQRKSGEKGGCSGYRNWKVQRDAAFQLASRHPGCVSVKTKESKVGWDNVGHARVDVNILWKKAYRPRNKKEDGITKFF